MSQDTTSIARPTVSRRLAILLVIAAACIGAWFASIAGLRPNVPKPITSSVVLPSAPLAPVVVPVRLHNYDVQDGMDYGYTAAVSAEQSRAGQVGANVIMFSYAGSRDGIYQLHARKGNMLQALECSKPCEIVKIMTVVDEDGQRQDVNVERLRNMPGMLAGLALEDAINGRLQPYAEYQGVQRYELWVDQGKGLTRKRIKDADAPIK